MKKTELAAMTIADLKALARKKKITVPAGAKKADIIAALMSGTAGAPAPEAKKKPAKKKAAAVAKTEAGKPARKAPAAPKRAAATPKVPPAVKAPKAPSREWQMPAGIEEPLMAQERVSDAKYFTGPAEKKPPLPYDYLPHEYGEDRITLLARDPYIAYAYWEVTAARIEKEKAWFGWDSKLVVRIYDVTGVQFDGRNATSYYDQEVSDLSGNWYFDFGRPTHSFCADLGLLAPSGRFLTLARSNVAAMPRDGVSDVRDEEWMLVDEEFMKLYGVPGGIPGGLSSPQVQEMIRQRRMMEITSPGLFSRPKQKPKRK
jgi:hypothetical protein